MKDINLHCISTTHDNTSFGQQGPNEAAGEVSRV